MTHTFTCTVCNKEKTHESDFTTGYAVNEKDEKICFACCADIDRQAMINDGNSKRLSLYLSENPPKEPVIVQAVHRQANCEVTNWPGTLRFPAYMWPTKSGKRMYVRFNGPEGHVWHGLHYGGNSQIVNCKRKS